MKLSRTAIKELAAAYRAVLKRAFIASMGIAIISPVMAESYDGTKDAPTNITEDKTFSENVSVSNYTNPSASTNSAVQVNKDIKVNFEQGLTLSNNQQGKSLHNNGGDVTILGSVYVTGNNNDKSGTTAGILNYGIENGADLKQSARLTINAGDDGVIEFSNNNAVGTGVSLYNEYSTATMTAGKIVFDGNELQFSDNPKNGYGANIFNSGKLEILGAENTFTNNKDYSERNATQSGGAALQSRGNNNHAASVTIGKDENSVNTFSDNMAMMNGGAIVNRNASEMTFNGNTEFTNNVATNGNGGAIYNFGQTDTTGAESPTITFNGDVTFKNNHAEKGDGGAIWNGTDGAKDVSAKIVFKKGTIFSGNHAQSGGAIWNSSDITMGDHVVFNGNYVDGSDNNGGAIYNTGNIEIGDGVSFVDNKASVDGGAGGAIYNAGTIKIGNNATFTDNAANSQGKTSRPYGGSDILNNGGTVEIGDYLTMERSADYYTKDVCYDTSIYSIGIGKITIGNNANFKNVLQALVTEKGDFSIGDEATFEGVGSRVGSAIATWGGNIKIGDNATFKNGHGRVLDIASGAAVITVGENALFINNTNGDYGAVVAFNGGKNSKMEFGDNFRAFYNKTDGNNVVYNETDNSMTFLGTSYFEHNSVRGKAGAVRNWGNLVFNGATMFNDNSDIKEGGAVTNGDGGSIVFNDFATFTNNKTQSDLAGAVYNAKGAKITFNNGANFAGNVANGKANDIFNDGTVNITGGTTTIDGGIIGNGTFTLADGSILNMGTTAIQQSQININGVVNVDILNARQYGRLYGEIEFGDNAQLNLTVATAGTYKIFGNDNDFAGINAGPLFEVQNNGAAGVVISTKDTDSLSSEHGLSTQAATALVAIANAGGVASSASIAAQNALASGNVEYVEAESAKVAPVNKPVVHSVSTSVQNQVLSLAVSRMSGGVMGRSGGDFVTTGSGMWAHGLINRSKMNGAFHGDTRGVAFGIDATFNRKYTFGMGYAHDNTDVHAGAQKTDIDSDTLFAYAQYKPNKWFINGAFNYTFADYTDKSDLFGINISSKHNVDSYGVQLLSGYDFASGVTPSVGARFLHIAQDEYTNGLVNVKASDTDFLTGVAGVKYAFDIVATPELTFSPELRAAATYDFMSDNATATVLVPGAAAYVVDSDRLSRFGGEFGIGMSALYRGITVSLNYDLDLHKDYTSQTGMLKFRYNF